MYLPPLVSAPATAVPYPSTLKHEGHVPASNIYIYCSFCLKHTSLVTYMDHYLTLRLWITGHLSEAFSDSAG